MLTLWRNLVHSPLRRVAVRQAVPGLRSLVLQNSSTASTNFCAPTPFVHRVDMHISDTHKWWFVQLFLECPRNLFHAMMLTVPVSGMKVVQHCRRHVNSVLKLRACIRVPPVPHPLQQVGMVQEGIVS